MRLLSHFPSVPLALVISLLALGWTSPAAAGDDAPTTQPDEIREALDRRLPAMRFENVAIGDILGFLHDRTKIDFDVDWDELRAAGITRDMQVTVRFRNRTLAEAIELIFDEANSRVRVVCRPGKGCVQITTEKKIS